MVQPVTAKQVYIINANSAIVLAWEFHGESGLHPLTVHVTANRNSVLALSDRLSSATYNTVPISFANVNSAGSLVPLTNSHDTKAPSSGWHWVDDHISALNEGDNAKVGIVIDIKENNITLAKLISNNYMFDYGPNKSIKSNEFGAVYNVFIS
jgi:hypothetical protein